VSQIKHLMGLTLASSSPDTLTTRSEWNSAFKKTKVMEFGSGGLPLLFACEHIGVTLDVQTADTFMVGPLDDPTGSGHTSLHEQQFLKRLIIAARTIAEAEIQQHMGVNLFGANADTLSSADLLALVAVAKHEKEAKEEDDKTLHDEIAKNAKCFLDLSAAIWDPDDEKPEHSETVTALRVKVDGLLSDRGKEELTSFRDNYGIKEYGVLKMRNEDLVFEVRTPQKIKTADSKSPLFVQSVPQSQA
jgi:hypothetical protein